ncbi:PREDICTED: FCH domain only protein 1 [Tinamus guttatus]|uniref:FCH domain only protein 1 n=1 Tax=Tinamus guttatus TaxID=94827 RepID=UPI00052F1D7C|nr:PREDICTED: FCH domain only protein 1 [Tinamus guttatus]
MVSHVAALAPALPETDPQETLVAGDGAGKGYPEAPGNSVAARAPTGVPPARPAAALFGPPLESFEAEDFSAALAPQSRSLSPSPSWSCGPSHSAPASLGERSFFGVSQPPLGLSRGPSPVVLGSQDALPVATAFTEYVHAYFKGRDADSCLVKGTGELTMSFPAGIVRVFGASAAPPVLSFRLLNAGAIEQFVPNAELLYSDPSQSDPSTKDFWLNMAALTGQLQRQAEQSPASSYYNVALLKYQGFTWPAPERRLSRPVQGSPALPPRFLEGDAGAGGCSGRGCCHPSNVLAG